MNNVFLKEFLMISNIETLIFMLLLVGIFYIIYKLIKIFDYSKLVMIGTFMGLVLGVAMQFYSGFVDDPMKITYISETVKWYSLIGGGYIDLIKMIVIPLVIISIIHVIISMDSKANISKLTKNTIIVSMAMVSISAIIGIVFAYAFGLGDSLTSVNGENAIRETSSVVDTFRKILPSNPVNAMLEFNIIGVVIISVFTGISARGVIMNTEYKLETFTKLINDLHKIISYLADLILGFMPFAIVPLLANTIAQNGLKSIVDVLMFIVVLYLAVLSMLLVQSIVLLINGISPIWYFKNAMSTLVLAFTSRSSVGVLPSTITTLTEKLDVDNATASFIASYSTTAGMQGCAGIFPAMIVVFVCNSVGIQFDLSLAITTIIVVTIGSIGIAGIPGTSITAASVSISGVGLASNFALANPILAIDPLLDMGRTMLNVSGGMVNTLVVNKVMKKVKK